MQVSFQWLLVFYVLYDSIEGSLDEVKLSQFASSDPMLLLGLKIAKTISRQKNLPFISDYIEEQLT